MQIKAIVDLNGTLFKPAHGKTMTGQITRTVFKELGFFRAAQMLLKYKFGQNKSETMDKIAPIAWKQMANVKFIDGAEDALRELLSHQNITVHICSKLAFRGYDEILKRFLLIKFPILRQVDEFVLIPADGSKKDFFNKFYDGRLNGKFITYAFDDEEENLNQAHDCGISRRKIGKDAFAKKQQTTADGPYSAHPTFADAVKNLFPKTM